MMLDTTKGIVKDWSDALIERMHRRNPGYGFDGGVSCLCAMVIMFSLLLIGALMIIWAIKQ